MQSVSCLNMSDKINCVILIVWVECDKIFDENDPDEMVRPRLKGVPCSPVTHSLSLPRPTVFGATVFRPTVFGPTVFRPTVFGPTVRLQSFPR